MASGVNVIAHNVMAMFADRQLGITGNIMTSSAEKLSSGYRINRAADDAAGLSISEKMRRQIRGLSQASLNAQDGISMVQTADGALAEVHDMLHRGSELSIKAANGTLSDNDRKMIDEEIQDLKREINRSTLSAKFNETKLFPVDGCRVSHAAAGFVRPEGSVNDPRYNWATGKFDAQVSFNQDGSIGSITAFGSPDAAEGVGGSSGTASYSALADKIINEYVPNAVTQILAAFPALGDGVDFSSMNMALNIKEIDGPSKTLAQVEAAFYTSSQNLSSLNLVVDMDDFSDSSISDPSSVGELESTLAHEMMHAVMDVATPANMYPNSGAEDYPKWFKEGTAQLAGGGFPTNWNAQLEHYIQSLSGPDDTSQDANIASYLQQYTAEGRPYGHGYLASAYMGWLANGDDAVTGQNIAKGMNSIFEAIRTAAPGTSFDSIVLEKTGKSPSQIADAIHEATSEATEFVRKLTYASTANGSKGAGSVITPSLSTGGSNILADTATPSSSRLNIDTTKVNYPDPSTDIPGIVQGARGSNGIALHVGADSLSTNKIDLLLFKVDSDGLGLTDTNTRTMKDAYKAMDEFHGALSVISFVRSYYGAIQNRLEHTIKNLGNVTENTTSAESAIRDTDMANEMARYSNRSILMQAGQSMLSQANAVNQGVLSLIQ